MFRRKRARGVYEPGITPQSVAAMAFRILLASMYTNFSCTCLAEHYQIVEETIPFPSLVTTLRGALPGTSILPHDWTGGDGVRRHGA